MRLTNLLTVASSSIHGRGVFARRSIPAGTYLGTYDGEKARRDGKFVLWVEEDGRTTARQGRAPLKFLNHSGEPNCCFDGFDLFAGRDIDAGEELTFDYGEADAFD